MKTVKTRLVWRMEAPCVDCPFYTDGPGLFLRKSLRIERWRSILASIRRGAPFMCHKTTRETGDGSDLICAGAIAYEDKLGIASQYRRVCERIAV